MPAFRGKINAPIIVANRRTDFLSYTLAALQSQSISVKQIQVPIVAAKDEIRCSPFFVYCRSGKVESVIRVTGIERRQLIGIDIQLEINLIYIPVRISAYPIAEE